MTHKSPLLHSLLCITLSISLLLPSGTPSCVFDSVKPNITSIPHKYVTYNGPVRNIVDMDIVKRSVPVGFQPIRFHVHYYNIKEELSDVEQSRLREVVSEMVTEVPQILSVIPVDGNLLLGRSDKACKQVYATGINKGKCALVNLAYDKETCLEPSFPIPESHLEGLYVWDSTNPDPIQVIRNEGDGVNDVDFILYVASRSTTTCLNVTSKVLASATYCQLDQNGRPIAGYINFCPQGLRPPVYNKGKALKAAMHEIFHALGFSSDLFEKYQLCESTDLGYTCHLHPSVIKMVQNAERMVTPNVVNLTSSHFGCITHPSVNEFGPIMETDKDGKVKSHWDGAFMYGSIMTPTIGLPHLTLLDYITLAAFEDTGWYQVDYAQADQFTWGKVGGCDFGLNPACEKSGSYFCTGSAKGCHHQLLDKGTCQTDTFLHECHVFRADEQSTCSSNAENLDISLVQSIGASYGEESRCFYSSLTSDPNASIEITGVCYEHKCKGTEDVYVKIGDLDWILCPWNSYKQIPGYRGTLKCPKKGLLCPPEVTTTSAPTTLSTTTKHRLDIDEAGIMSIDLIFSRISLSDLQENKLEDPFCELVNAEIVLLTSVNLRRISHVQLISGSVIFRFDLSPAEYSDDGPPSMTVFTILKEAILLGNFTILLDSGGKQVTYIADDIKSLSRGPVPLDKGISSGAIAGIVVATLLLAAAILIYLVHRYKSTHTPVVPVQRQVHPSPPESSAPASASNPSRSQARHRRGSTSTEIYNASFSNGALPHQPMDSDEPPTRKSSLVKLHPEKSSLSEPKSDDQRREHRPSHISIASTISGFSGQHPGPDFSRCSSAGTAISARDIHLTASTDELHNLEI